MAGWERRRAAKSGRSWLAGLALALVAGCSQPEGEAPAARGRQALTSTDGSTGVPACDEYLDQYETCMRSRLPESVFSQHLQGIRRQRAAWRAMADTEAKRASLVHVCRQASAVARAEFGSCSWSPAVCGNGTLEGGEQCDDGNTLNGDGCSASCTTEPRCTDGIRNGTETDVDCGGSCAACAAGRSCSQNSDCSTGSCSGNTCVTPSSCSAATATDLGAPGQVTRVSNAACLRIQNGYPSWWGTSRTFQFQSQASGTYPVPFTWSNSCAGTSGTQSFTADWQTHVLGPASSACATVIQLNGNGAGQVSLTYYPN